MTLASASVFEVRNAGNDTNGGGFVTGATGTDYSQQNSKNSGGTDGSTTDAVAVGTTTLTSATASFAASIVGNIIYLQGGTGTLAAGWYQAITFTNSTTIVLDRTVATGTGITMNIGGALATPNIGFPLCTTDGMMCYIKNASTYSTATGIAITTSITNNNNAPIRFIGYGSTRGDGGQATIQASVTVTNILSGGPANTFHRFENLIIDGNSKSSTAAFSGNASSTTYYAYFYNCVMKNCSSSRPLQIGRGGGFYSCEISGNTVTSNNLGIIGGQQNPSNLIVVACYFHDNVTQSTNVGGCILGNPTGGAGTANSTILLNNIFYNNTGTGMCAVLLNGGSLVMRSNVVHLNGSDGLRVTASETQVYPYEVSDNIFTSNGGYGIDMLVYNTYTDNNAGVHNNAYYNNTSGSYNKIAAGTGDVTLTGLPYVSVPTNFALNTTASQGAACRSVGYPGTVPITGSVATGYEDIGVVRHQDAGGASGGSYTFSG